MEETIAEGKLSKGISFVLRFHSDTDIPPPGITSTFG
jgi:hypothetical protein